MEERPAGHSDFDVMRDGDAQLKAYQCVSAIRCEKERTKDMEDEVKKVNVPPVQSLPLGHNLKFVRLSCRIISRVYVSLPLWSTEVLKFHGGPPVPLGRQHDVSSHVLSACVSDCLSSEPINVLWQPFVTLSYRGYCRRSQHKH
ncbi:hypothetical protein Q8A67_003347 [Cirrhinus molitorella]|uniref:Uncharacterized protein n=1 Tax=Cirrhinus molitorella TaxID=172907 RepID=A0AA88Q7U8_9TELE|nr:hypothetical protein Q8A67_003347 [Cirrhinus molitorella]